MSFLISLGKKIMPQRTRKRLKEYMKKTGKVDLPYSLYSKLFFLSVFSVILTYFFLILPALKDFQPAIVIGISAFVLTFGAIIFLFVLSLFLWVYYEFVIFKRTRKIEKVLPDFLEEVATNLKAGMSFDKALWNSVEPDFDILANEIEIVAKKVMAGEDTEKALLEFASKYKSILLEESIDMIIVGLRSGSNIADLIEKIVENVKDAYFLRKELVASVTSYVIFISATAIVISPVLFALSFNMMQIVQGLGEKLTVGGLVGAGGASATNIEPKDFITFSKISIIIIAVISSMIIADLREGSIKAGLKYIIMFAPIAFLVYVVSLGIFSGLFGFI